MLRVGSLAPDFTLNDQRGEPFRLADFRGRMNVLLVFIPAAFTPICTTEVPALDALADRFVGEANTAPIVVTPDNAPTNAAWMRHLGATHVRMLSDWNPHGAVSRAYGAWMPADALCARASVLVDRSGRVAYAEDVGKFGKRAMPSLLAVATRAAGGTPAPAGATVAMPLDLPVVYVSNSCPHCRRVREWIAKNGLGDRIVVRSVEGDGAAMRELLAVAPSGGVPTLAINGILVAQGDDAVIARLAARGR